MKSEEERVSEALPQWLYDIPELDVSQGLMNCGSEESYASVLKVFHQTAEQKADEIQDLYERGDVDGFTIKVHALKSSARIIGAVKLSDMARNLEMAGKQKDTDFIRQNTAELLLKYRELDQNLQALDRQAGKRPELSEDMRKEAFQTMAEIAESMDFGMMENLLQDLKKYELSPEDTNTLKQIEGLLMELDWDGIGKTVGTVMAQGM